MGLVYEQGILFLQISKNALGSFPLLISLVPDEFFSVALVAITVRVPHMPGPSTFNNGPDILIFGLPSQFPSDFF